MSIRANNDKPVEGDPATVLAQAASSDAALSEANSYCIASPDNPLKRNLVVSIRASLNDLCLQKSKGAWQPSSDALKSIFQQKRFTSLDGSADPQGDLKSVVLHEMNVTHVASTFPVSLGAKITGCDDSTFSSTGSAYSLIVPPNSQSAIERTIQKDDVSTAYDFAKKVRRRACLSTRLFIHILTTVSVFVRSFPGYAVACFVFVNSDNRPYC